MNKEEAIAKFDEIVKRANASTDYKKYALEFSDFAYELINQLD